MEATNLCDGLLDAVAAHLLVWSALTQTLSKWRNLAEEDVNAEGNEIIKKTLEWMVGPMK